MRVLEKERLALKTYVACKTNGIEPDEENRYKLEQICKYMKQDFIKNLLKSFGKYDKCSYHLKKDKWYIRLDYCHSKRSLLISQDSLFVKSHGGQVNV